MREALQGGSGNGEGDLPLWAPTEDQVHLPALRHLAQVGVSEAAVQQVGMGPWPECRKRHFYVHGMRLSPPRRAGVLQRWRWAVCSKGPLVISSPPRWGGKPRWGWSNAGLLGDVSLGPAPCLWEDDPSAMGSGLPGGPRRRSPPLCILDGESHLATGLVWGGWVPTDVPMQTWGRPLSSRNPKWSNLNPTESWALIPDDGMCVEVE